MTIILYGKLPWSYFRLAIDNCIEDHAHENELSLVFVSTTTPGSPGVFIGSLINFEGMKPVIAFVIATTLLAGCSKNSAGENDTELPVISLNTPADNQVFSAGQSIVISGSITDNKYIAEVHIHVSNTNTGELLMDVHLYPASSSTTFSQPITAAAGINYKIQIIAKDRAVNEAISTVYVSCN